MLCAYHHVVEPCEVDHICHHYEKQNDYNISPQLLPLLQLLRCLFGYRFPYVDFRVSMHNRNLQSFVFVYLYAIPFCESVTYHITWLKLMSVDECGLMHVFSIGKHC